MRYDCQWDCNQSSNAIDVSLHTLLHLTFPNYYSNLNYLFNKILCHRMILKIEHHIYALYMCSLGIMLRAYCFTRVRSTVRPALVWSIGFIRLISYDYIIFLDDFRTGCRILHFDDILCRGFSYLLVYRGRIHIFRQFCFSNNFQRMAKC